MSLALCGKICDWETANKAADFPQEKFYDAQNHLRVFNDCVEFMKAVAPLDGKPRTHGCENFVGQLPTADPVTLRELLTRRKKPAQKALAKGSPE